MSKFFGKIGYAYTDEVKPGVWQDIVTERDYYGDLLRNTSRRYEGSGQQANDNIIISNDISILADPFALDHFAYIKYAEFMGAKWKVTNVEIQYPRLILTLGGVYNG